MVVNGPLALATSFNPWANEAKHEVSTCRVQKSRSVTGWYLVELSWISSICEFALISLFMPLVALALRLLNILPARDFLGVSSRAARPRLTKPRVSWLSL